MLVCGACEANILMLIIGHVTGQSVNEQTVEYCYEVGENQERCFKAVSSDSSGARKTWPQARDWCNDQGDGYSLAIVRDDATQDALARFLTDYELTNSNVWIGARQTKNSRWRWIDGTVEPGEL